VFRERQFVDILSLVWKTVLRDAPPNDTGGTIGARVRALRRERGLTLKALGARAGLSHPFLSQLERGLARPSLGSIERIAGALGIPVAQLWAETAPPAPLRLVRNGEGPSLGHEGGAPGGLRELAPHGDPVAVHEWTGGSRSWPPEATALDGHVLVYVIRGGLEVEVADATHALGDGDALLFDGRQPHRMRRTGGPATRALIVVSA
jgi:transcriptional regulator with XRE-family HTH domain